MMNSNKILLTIVLEEGFSPSEKKVVPTCVKQILINEFAYNFMTGLHCPDIKIGIGVWKKKMSEGERLNWHMSDLCRRDLGISWKAEVLAD